MSEREPGRADHGDDETALRLLRLAGVRPNAPRDVEDRVRAAVREHWAQRLETGRKRRRLWLVGPASAAALLLAVVAIRWLPRGGVQVATVEVVDGYVEIVGRGSRAVANVRLAVPEGAAVLTGRGGRAALRLSGGVSLRLDEATQAVLEGPAAVRLEKGAVYVDSGPDTEGGGVTVIAGLDHVRDVGTQFEVRLDGDSLRVTVREGLVSLGRDAGEATVAAGQQLRVASDGSAVAAAVTPYDSMWGWVQAVAPRPRLDGATVRELLVWVARETGLTVRWQPSVERGEAERIVLHGSLESLRPDEVPAAVLPTCGLGARVEEGWLIVGAAAP